MTDQHAECVLSLRLADVPIRVRLEPADEAPFVDARFGAYRGHGLNEIALSVRRDETATIAQPEGSEWPGALGALRADGTVVFEREGERLEYDPQRRAGHAVVAHPRTVGLRPVEDPTAIDTPLRLLLSFVLPRENGLLLHASGYGDERGAVVFAAASGGGKTTTATKLPPANVLSDDQVALRVYPQGWDAFALPFVGLYARPTVPRRTPLRALVLLAKSDRESLDRVAPPEAVARLLACSPYFVRNDPVASTLLDLASSLVRAVPVYRLGIRRDDAVMPVVERLLGA